MTDQFVGEIRIFGFNFAPTGWAFCNGQVLPISTNTALFSLLGTSYGGNGTSNFALPDLQGRAALHAGTGPGLSQYSLGEQTGASTVTLLQTEIPAHNHAAQALILAEHDTNTPSASTVLGLSAPNPIYSKVSTDPLVPFSPKAIGLTGGSQPHENMQPYLMLNFCIALQGIYPARN